MDHEFVFLDEPAITVEIACLELNHVIAVLVARVSESDNPDRLCRWDVGTKFRARDFDVTPGIGPVQKGAYSAAVLRECNDNDDDDQDRSSRNSPFTRA